MSLVTEVNFNKIWKASHQNREIFASYLSNFDDIIQTRLDGLTTACAADDRTALRSILHKMRPQIEFFDLIETSSLMIDLESRYDNMDSHALKSKIEHINKNLVAAHELVKLKLVELQNSSDPICYGD